MNKLKNCQYKDVDETIANIFEKTGTTEDKLIEVLIKAQKYSEHNYLSEEVLKKVSRGMNIPLTKVYGIASFYSMLSTEKRGKYVIQICNSAPCYLRNGKEIVKIFQDILGIKIGEITEDGLISLEFTSCIGACDIAPAVKINGKLYGDLDRGKIFNILSSIRRGDF